MEVQMLSREEAAHYGFTHKATVPYTDLTDTAGLTQTIPIYPQSGTAPIGTMIRKAAVKVTTAFVGCTTMGVEIGDGSDVNRNLASSDLKATAGTWDVAVPASTSPSVFNAADTIDAKFTATTDNLTELTAGEVEIYLDVVELNALGTAG